MIKRQKINPPVDETIKNGDSKYVTPTEKDDLSLPALIVFQGMRGSGKTYAAVQLAKHFENKGYIQRTFLLNPNIEDKKEEEEEESPTDIFRSNLKTLDEDDICSDEHAFTLALDQVLERVKEDWKKYEEYQLQKLILDKILHKIPLNPKEARVAGTLGDGTLIKPKRVPLKRHLLILDDCQSTSVYGVGKANKLNHLAIRHRHIPLTIFFLVQTWVGVPRTLRLNATHYVIFKTGDEVQLEQICSLFANTIKKETFMKVYNEAVNDKHGFLLVDVVPKEEYQRFRKGFNEFLIPFDGDIRSIHAEDKTKTL